MKFGKHLLSNMPNDWRFNFIDYSGLKYFVKSNVAATAWDDNLEAKFISMLEEELKKVSDFGFVKHNELSSHVQYVKHQISKLSHPSLSPKSQELKQEMDEITEDIKKLSSFNSLNYTAFLKILKKHDKITSYKLKHTFLARLTNQPFYKENFDKIIVTLSSLYLALKPADTLSDGVPLTVGEGMRVRQHTLKYWVHADNITAVKVAIMQNLPVQVYKKDPIHPKTYEINCNSVYYDNDQLQQYHAFYDKREGAAFIRFCWYDESPEKVHAERITYTNEDSVTESLELKEKHVNAFIKGEFKLEDRVDKMRAIGRSEEEVAATVKLGDEIQQLIVSEHMAPAVRTTYNRTTFQHIIDHDVRVTLDTDLSLTREWGLNGDSWRRLDLQSQNDPMTRISHSPVVFPYAILQIRVDTQMPKPDWITCLTEGHLVEPVPKFSKYVHGCATLLEEMVRLLPFWLPQMEKDIRKEPKPEPLLISSAGEDNQVVLPNRGQDLSRSTTTLNAEEGEEDDEEASLLGQKIRNISRLSSLVSGQLDQ
eukprot:Ihof_evm15s43 gene=Ihof_evmTU15s43